VPDPQVVVIAGDELAHQWRDVAREGGLPPERAALVADERIAGDLAAAFPRAQFVIATGNNDEPCGDYRSSSGGAYREALARIWAPLAGRGNASPDFARDFAASGHYVARLPGGMRAVVVNSVVLSAFYGGDCNGGNRDAGERELQWLDAALGASPDPAIVVMHVPPGFDGQTTAMLRDAYAFPLLDRSKGERFDGILARYRERVPFAIAGHLHRFDFRIAGGVPVAIASSISPVYRNNPAFYELRVTPSGIAGILPVVYDPNRDRFVRRPDLAALLGLPAFDAASLRAFSERLRHDPAMRATWLSVHDVWGPKSGDWKALVCAQTELGDGYAWCAGVAQRQIAASIIAGLAIAGSAAFAYLRRRRGTLR
jgi:hypothetical protein